MVGHGRDRSGPRPSCGRRTYGRPRRGWPSSAAIRPASGCGRGRRGGTRPRRPRWGRFGRAMRSILDVLVGEPIVVVGEPSVSIPSLRSSRRSRTSRAVAYRWTASCRVITASSAAAIGISAISRLACARLSQPASQHGRLGRPPAPRLLQQLTRLLQAGLGLLELPQGRPRAHFLHRVLSLPLRTRTIAGQDARTRFVNRRRLKYKLKDVQTRTPTPRESVRHARRTADRQCRRRA